MIQGSLSQYSPRNVGSQLSSLPPESTAASPSSIRSPHLGNLEQQPSATTHGITFSFTPSFDSAITVANSSSDPSAPCLCGIASACEPCTQNRTLLSQQSHLNGTHADVWRAESYDSDDEFMEREFLHRPSVDTDWQAFQKANTRNAPTGKGPFATLPKSALYGGDRSFKLRPGDIKLPAKGQVDEVKRDESSRMSWPPAERCTALFGEWQPSQGGQQEDSFPDLRQFWRGRVNSS